MFAKAHLPQSLKAEELDRYLALGWFRMGQTIFTTSFLNFKNQFYSAIWLRVCLKEFNKNKTQEKLYQINASFEVKFKSLEITPEKEELFARYKESVPFQPSASLHHLLFGKSFTNIYNTIEVNVYDNQKLIAIGFFDLGINSAAGISSFYDPDYKKHSLGKYLIYLKMEYCKNLGLGYFYPGYFAPGYPSFNYKLEMGKPAIQYFKLDSQEWISLEKYRSEFTQFYLMENKLHALLNQLAPYILSCQIYNYEFFDANLIPDLQGADLFDFPLFIHFESDNKIDIYLIVYDIRDHHFHLLRCSSLWTGNTPDKIPGVYSSNLLKLEQVIFSTPRVDTMVSMLAGEIRNEIERSAQS